MSTAVLKPENKCGKIRMLRFSALSFAYKRPLIMEFAFFSWQSVAVCAAYFAAGIIDAISGGGGLITVPALMTLGIPAHYIAGTNQCSALMGNLASIYKYARTGNVHFRSGIITAVTAIIGGIIGAELNMIIPEKYLETVMILLMPLIALMVFLKKDFGEDDRSATLSAFRLFMRAALIGLFAGAYQGFYGPGAGMIYMLALALLIRLNLVKASGTARFVSAFACMSASLTYAVSGLVIWRIVIVATVFNIAGNYLGANLAIKKGAKLIRPVLLLVLALLFIKLALKL